MGATALVGLLGLMNFSLHLTAQTPAPEGLSCPNRSRLLLVSSAAVELEPGIPPCSATAVMQLVENGASIVHLQLEESIDSVPFVFCASSLQEATGRRGLIRKMASNRVRERFYKGTDEAIMTLDMAAELVRDRAGLYLEVRGTGHSRDFYAEILEILERTGLSRCSFIKADNQVAWPLLLGKIRVEASLDQIGGFSTTTARNYFVRLPVEELEKQPVKAWRAAGLVVFAIVPGRETADLKEKIDRALQIGVDGIEIDPQTLRLIRPILDARQ